jgi:hypothetical protein
MKNPIHPDTVMVRVKPYPQNSYYVGNGWKAKFSCSCCGREVWQHLNFLGQRQMVCNGRKIVKTEIPDPEIEAYSTLDI